MQTDLSSSKINCKNCNYEYEGNYCPSCGQKHITERITVKHSISSLFHTIFNFERGMWYTIGQMMTNPQGVIRNYLNGITRPYVHPFRFLFLWITVQVFLMASTGMFEMTQSEFTNGMTEGMSEDMKVDAKQGEQFAKVIQGKMLQYMNILLVLCMPFVAFATKLFFRKPKYNFAEHLVVNSFMYGESLILTTISVPVFLINNDLGMNLQLVGFFISIAYMCYTYWKVFSGNLFVTFIKTILVLVVWMIGILLLMTILMLLIGVYFIIFDAETLKNMQQAGSVTMI